jgi:hypothetical protein
MLSRLDFAPMETQTIYHKMLHKHLLPSNLYQMPCSSGNANPQSENLEQSISKSSYKPIPTLRTTIPPSGEHKHTMAHLQLLFCPRALYVAFSLMYRYPMESLRTYFTQTKQGVTSSISKSTTKSQQTHPHRNHANAVTI